MIDCHCHLDHPLFDKDRDQVVEAAKTSGISVIITNGIDPGTNRKSLELARRYSIVKAGLGVYPRSAIKHETEQEGKKYTSFDIGEELGFITDHKKEVIAIGEVGLDGVRGIDTPQKKDFELMIELAEKLKKPIIVHSRKAEAEVLALLETSKLKVILHAFHGKRRLVQKAIDNGWYFSVSTHIARSQEMQYIAKEAPLSKLFPETDAPFLSPFPGKRNEPAFVIEAIKKIAEIKGLDMEETSKNIWKNYQKVFV
ncbi:MAG TPA: TatD family hydrolase [Candidatus Nanoarchaeia archaeon]|nr:TatD family hydrolase [Candidatus Nanoarchaeia archaeon]